MQLTRRSLLAGASMTALALAMPISSAVPLDREALTELADYIYTTMQRWDEENRVYLFGYETGKSYQEIQAEWLDKDTIVEATHQALKISFRELQEDEHDYILMRDGKLTFYGQYVVYGLPIAPSDRESRVFRLLDRLAPHYLS